jgi:hypothetical protein
MASYDRNQESQEEGRRPRRRPQKSGPPLVPILGLILVIAGVIFIARVAAKNQKPEPEPPKEIDASDVYGDLPEEQSPTREKSGRKRSRVTSRAPSGLQDNATWIEALKIAERADAVFAEAKKARMDGNHASWNKKGNEAKELYDRAFTLTAVWEEELLGEFGDTDRQVRDIIHIRNRWNDAKLVLHKSTGRN